MATKKIAEGEDEKKFQKKLQRRLELSRAANLAKFHRFEILDEVFQCFVATNERKGKTCSWKEICSIDSEHPRYFTFVHDEIKYLATVFRKDSSDSR